MSAFTGKTFAGHKPLQVILDQCKAEGLIVNRAKFDEGGDHIGIIGGGCSLTYSTFNGRFWGTTPDGIEFSSDSTEHEHEPWFQALLAFFYAETRAETFFAPGSAS